MARNKKWLAINGGGGEPPLAVALQPFHSTKAYQALPQAALATFLWRR